MSPKISKIYPIGHKLLNFMKKYQKEIVKLTALEALKTLFDFAASFHGASSIYKKDYYRYVKDRNIDRDEFREKIYYLKKYGYIESVFENRQKIFKITKKGNNHLVESEKEDFRPKIPNHWDGRWRVVVFDIPEKKKEVRNYFRRKIVEFGFIQAQKSVYVFPFECEQEVLRLVQKLGVEKNVTIIKAFVLQGEQIFAKKFVQLGILKREYFKDIK